MLSCEVERRSNVEGILAKATNSKESSSITMMFTVLRKMPSDAQDAIKTAYLRVQCRSSAKLLWNRALNTGERKRLGADYQTALKRHGGTVQIWLHLRGGTPQRAIVDVAHALNMLSDSDRRWLMRELGEPRRSTESSAELEWNKELGELRLNGKVIRRTRVAVAKKLVTILDAFQECAWPERMDDPLPPSTDVNRLRDTVKVLNRGLQRIRFFADGTGKGIRWKVL